MNKSKKDKKAGKYHTPQTRKFIKDALKAGKSKKHIAAHLGFNSKITQYIIDRWGLDEGLAIPRLRGIK